MKIGVFDSGYGGLTILKEIRAKLPEYNYIYLGDNARNPYGTRSFEIVYQFTLEAVKTLFEKGCNLVILACNTASAKALRSIQQNDLPKIDPSKRVLGVIRPTVELLPQVSKTGHIGILATPGTVKSLSYSIELHKINAEMKITEHACPMWVPIVENNEIASPGADFFIQRETETLMKIDPEIDTVVLGCTHYPLMAHKIKRYLPENVNILCQGEIVANSLADYLIRHPEIERKIGKNREINYFTTEHTEKFDSLASLFLGHPIESEIISIKEK